MMKGLFVPTLFPPYGSSNSDTLPPPRCWWALGMHAYSFTPPSSSSLSSFIIIIHCKPETILTHPVVGILKDEIFHISDKNIFIDYTSSLEKY